VSLASATFMIVSTQFVYFQHYGKDDLIAVDTSRIAASVVSGVGFLGAGAILRVGISVQGLTTAASLWLLPLDHLRKSLPGQGRQSNTGAQRVQEGTIRRARGVRRHPHLTSFCVGHPGED